MTEKGKAARGPGLEGGQGAGGGRSTDSGLRVDERALQLLNREPPEGYREQWTAQLAENRKDERRDLISVVVFRLGREWYALPASVFHEFTKITAIHRIPHRSNFVLLGVTSVRGELHLALSLHALLGIQEEASVGEDSGKRRFPRMAVLRHGGESFVVPVDEVFRIHSLAEDELERPPVNIEKAAATRTRGLFDCEGRTVALLDEGLLFHNMRKGLE